MNINISQLRTIVEKSLDNSKAEEIVVIDLKGKTDIADYMIIASGSSSRHVASIASKLHQDLRKEGIKGIEPEGMGTCDWVLIDAGDIIAHIFKPETRKTYDLEGMWSVDIAAKEAAKV